MILYRNHYLVVLLFSGAIFPTLVIGGGAGDELTDAIGDTYIVYGDPSPTDVATNLELTTMETPQTVTSISRLQLDDFGLIKINDALDYAPGVTVEEIETNRTYYTARGFDIVNFQYDGVGVPFVSGLNLGKQDTAIYERVEVVKGAAGLITGLANPSATINYVRKRPTKTRQSSVAVSLGQWDNRRVESDISGSIAPFINGRLVVAYDEGRSYLDRYQDKTKLFYGILAFDISDSTKFTVGYSYDNDDSRGVLWGALPLLYSDDSQTDYKASTSNAPDWTFADSKKRQTFIEFKQDLSDLWSFNVHFVHDKDKYDSELFYVYGVPNRATEIGLKGWSSAYWRKQVQKNSEVFLSGDIDLFGRYHQVVFGYSDSDIELKQQSTSDPANGYPVLGSDWAEGNTPRMNFTSSKATDAGDIDLRQTAYYLATRWNILDNFHVLLGARNTNLNQSGMSYGADSKSKADETTPYYGATWEAFDSVALYGSYSEVFKQQSWVNSGLRPLGPTLGESTEFGIKKSFNNGRATLTIARFASDQKNFGEFVGRNDDGIAIYRGIDLKSRGYEIELAGELTDGFNVGAGYTKVDIEDKRTGKDARTFIPSDMLKMSITYNVPSVAGLRVGSVMKWQDTIHISDRQIKQDAYTLVDLVAHYQLNNELSLSVNIDNATDEKYLKSLYWAQGYYGAPRNISASLRWTL